MAVCLLPILAEDSSAEDETEAPHYQMLLDFGNGHTEWSDTISGTTVEAAIVSAFGTRAVFGDRDGERTVLSVDGTFEVTVGTGSSRQVCSWHIYMWNSVEWEMLTDDVTERYSKGFLALAYYPDSSVTPVSNPDYRDVWTSSAGTRLHRE